MQNDEQAIRDLLATWRAATEAGDAEKLRGLMAEDVVYLMPRNPPMRGREAFLTQFQKGVETQRLAYTYALEELRIAGDFAYCSCHLNVTATPLKDGAPMRLVGYTLTIFRKQPDGSWVLSRDANMLAPLPG